MSRSRNWVFTLNNPISREPDWPVTVKAATWQYEVGSSGTPHLQGYIEMVNPTGLTGMKKMKCIKGAHFEPRRGTREQAIAYANKEETRVEGPWTYGVFEEFGPGRRSDIDEFCKAAEDGLKESDVIFSFPGIVAKYPRFVASFYEALRVRQLPQIEFVPRPGWQIRLWELLTQEPHPRQIHWFSDSVGNAGKSTFATAYAATNSAYIVTPGKYADILYAYRFERVVFFDWPRDADDRFPYSVVESFKNGYFLSTKYDVRRCRFSTPHVVVFSNSLPDQSKLSIDRFIINEI